MSHEGRRHCGPQVQELAAAGCRRRANPFQFRRHWASEFSHASRRPDNTPILQIMGSIEWVGQRDARRHLRSTTAACSVLPPPMRLCLQVQRLEAVCEWSLPRLSY